MQTNKILTASLLDIIFDGRNKSYGAYELRATYDDRVKKSMVLTLSIISFVIAILVIKKSPSETDIPLYKFQDPTWVDIKPPEEQPLIEPPARNTASAPQQVLTEPFTSMTIVPDSDVTEDPPTQEEVSRAQVGTERLTGEEPTGIVQGANSNISNGDPVAPIEPVLVNEPVHHVDVAAEFAGNWENFLRKNLDAQIPVENNAPVGNHTIVIQFIVDAEGNVSEIKPLTNIGYGMEQEAIRVLKKATRWKPAKQNGTAVKAYRRQPITFQVLED